MSLRRDYGYRFGIITIMFLLWKGTISDGDCSLTINNAAQHYAGKYGFRFEDNSEPTLKWTFIQRYLNVNITDLTEKPEIIITPQKNMVAGKSVTLTCKPPGTGKCPGTAPEITWGKLEKNNKAASDRYIICGGKNMTISQCKESAITFTPSQNDHRTSITCTATFPWVKKSPQSSVTLNVQYPPSISFSSDIQGQSATNDSVSVDNGGSVLFRYSVDSNPPANVTLMRGEERIVSTVTGQELILNLLNITLREAGTYTISASNQHGRNNKSVIVHAGHTNHTLLPHTHHTQPPHTQPYTSHTATTYSAIHVTQPPYTRHTSHTDTYTRHILSHTRHTQPPHTHHTQPPDTQPYTSHTASTYSAIHVTHSHHILSHTHHTQPPHTQPYTSHTATTYSAIHVTHSHHILRHTRHTTTIYTSHTASTYSAIHRAGLRCSGALCETILWRPPLLSVSFWTPSKNFRSIHNLSPPSPSTKPLHLFTKTPGHHFIKLLATPSPSLIPWPPLHQTPGHPFPFINPLQPLHQFPPTPLSALCPIHQPPDLLINPSHPFSQPSAPIHQPPTHSSILSHPFSQPPDPLINPFPPFLSPLPPFISPRPPHQSLPTPFLSPLPHSSPTFPPFQSPAN
ncbi:sialic acid-binding Ig-like lectin 12 [Pelobates cultripes]|uniref:Sialic acid-binding Ig-like lectin 12 n=1 Tax=Pelobates cultripes TaxID=61616 RepID=A0AAD1WMV7_PELCU|nr:sialic acid-binding Ig-like lectin 12 [Pelobates cultripes]